MVLKCSIEMRSMSYAWRGLKEQLGEEVDGKISAMRFLKGKMVRWPSLGGGEGVCVHIYIFILIWPVFAVIEAGVVKYQYRGVDTSLFLLGLVSERMVTYYNPLKWLFKYTLLKKKSV